MKYATFSPDTEITGRSVLIIFSKDFPFTNPSVRDLMKNEGLDNISPESWYCQQNCLNVLKALELHHGGNAVEFVGYMMKTEFHTLPVTDLEADLLFVDTGYQLSHRSSGEIGHYELISFDESARTAVMECCNPYPNEFDKGLLRAVLRKHIPEPEYCEVITDMTKESRLTGGEKCTFILKW